MMPAKQYTDGAFALVVRDKQFLLANTHVMEGEFWSIPGGVVDPGESFKEGATREVFEETGIICRPIKLIYEIDVATTKDLHLHFYLAEYISGDINIDPKEVQSAQWFYESDLERLNYAFSNTHLVIRRALTALK